jgi:hypothetical protein
LRAGRKNKTGTQLFSQSRPSLDPARNPDHVRRTRRFPTPEHSVAGSRIHPTTDATDRPARRSRNQTLKSAIFHPPVFYPPLPDFDQGRVINWGVKNSLTRRSIPKAAASVLRVLLTERLMTKK